MATPQTPQTPRPAVPVTGDELLQHRLKQLEDWRVNSAATVTRLERDSDLQKLEAATVKALLVEHRTETREALTALTTSLARIHARLDELSTAEAREQGRIAGEKAATVRTGKIIGATLGAAIGVSGVVVGLLTLLLG